jgi:hypothetical protein
MTTDPGCGILSRPGHVNGDNGKKFSAEFTHPILIFRSLTPQAEGVDNYGDGAETHGRRKIPS